LSVFPKNNNIIYTAQTGAEDIALDEFEDYS
jgi:hypothetical protein